jgi:hypothetical protein
VKVLEYLQTLFLNSESNLLLHFFPRSSFRFFYLEFFSSVEQNWCSEVCFIRRTQSRPLWKIVCREFYINYWFPRRWERNFFFSQKLDKRNRCYKIFIELLYDLNIPGRVMRVSFFKSSFCLHIPR